MKITFKPLATEDLQLLLKWLETPHVKAWWDQDVKWTPELIEEKYGCYINRDASLKPLKAFILEVDGNPIGYIQLYNVHDFPRDEDVTELPSLTAAIDWYIGEGEYVGKGVGAKALNVFLTEHVFPNFKNVFVDPDTANVAAIRAYEKAGFKKIKQVKNREVTWMLK